MRSWPVSTRLSSRSTSRSALHWTLVQRTEQQRAHRPNAASQKQQSTTQRGTVQISTKHYSSGQTAQSTGNKKQLSTARQGVEQCITAQQWVQNSPSQPNTKLHKFIQAALVLKIHSSVYSPHADLRPACFSAPAGAPGHETAAGTCREGASSGAAAAEPAGEGAGEASERAACFQPEPQGQGALQRE